MSFDLEVVNDYDENSNGPDSLNSPIRSQSQSINRYLRSSSAKRRQWRDENCRFCNEDHDRVSLHYHLQGNKQCLFYYERTLHVKKIEAVMVMLFDCLFCNSKFSKLKAE